MDVTPEETFQNTAFEEYKDSSSPTSSENAKFAEVEWGSNKFGMVILIQLWHV